jgi:hypothetical protein
MLGTWQLADGEGLEDAQPLGIRKGATDGGVALSIDLCGDRQVVQHAETIAEFAQMRK